MFSVTKHITLACGFVVTWYYFPRVACLMEEQVIGGMFPSSCLNEFYTFIICILILLCQCINLWNRCYDIDVD